MARGINKITGGYLFPLRGIIGQKHYVYTRYLQKIIIKPLTIRRCIKTENYEMPIGFGMALAQNPAAMQKFANLSKEEKQKIIAGTHSVRSKAEMHSYVNEILSYR